MKLPSELLHPPRTSSVLPFWFWKDTLDEREIIRQIADFQDHGVHGFIIHPRVGLPRDLGWMSAPLLHFYRVAIAEAQRRNMLVGLYDEGMYPSGSSCGQVVAENADYACRCLAKVDLAAGESPRLSADETLVAVVARRQGERVAIIDRQAHSVIRGLHYMGEGPDEDTPPAADILNPDAVAAFLRLVYGRFAENLPEYFGKTVFAIFTDEPSLLGRGAPADALPGTRGILSHVNRILGYDFTPHLPALWYEDEPDAARHRTNYWRAVHQRLEETYYRQLSGWCESHGIALTGHPEKGDDIGTLRFFHIPGQDLVWRWVLPDQPTALEGEQSTQAKCSSSAMIHGGRQRNGNECCGAYGHELTWDEMQWLARWCFVRGVNLLYPHAFYYSVRAPRGDERPPDVGPHSAWWPRYREYADACSRLSWLNTDSTHICDLAILGTSDWLPWRSARGCYEHQMDFNYLEERDLLDRATITADGIRIAGMCYRALILEHTPAVPVLAALAPFDQAGRVFRFSADAPAANLLEQIAKKTAPAVRIEPASPALRVRQVRKCGFSAFLLFNEQKAPLSIRLDLPVHGPRYRFDTVSAQLTELAADAQLALSGHALQVVLVPDAI